MTPRERMVAGVKGRQALRQRAAVRELRAMVSVGLEQARRGALLDGEAVFRELERRNPKQRSR